MQEQLINAAVKEGLFALLFVGLLWWVLRESSRREDKLMEESKRREDVILQTLTKIEGHLGALSQAYKNISEYLFETTVENKEVKK